MNIKLLLVSRKFQFNTYERRIRLFFLIWKLHNSHATDKTIVSTFFQTPSMQFCQTETENNSLNKLLLLCLSNKFDCQERSPPISAIYQANTADIRPYEEKKRGSVSTSGGNYAPLL